MQVNNPLSKKDDLTLEVYEVDERRHEHEHPQVDEILKDISKEENEKVNEDQLCLDDIISSYMKNSLHADPNDEEVLESVPIFF